MKKMKLFTLLALSSLILACTGEKTEATSAPATTEVIVTEVAGDKTPSDFEAQKMTEVPVVQTPAQESVTKEAEKGVENVTGKIADGAKDVVGGAANVVEKTGDGAVKVVEKVGDGTKDVAEKVVGGVADGVEKVGDGVKDLVEKID